MKIAPYEHIYLGKSQLLNQDNLNSKNQDNLNPKNSVSSSNKNFTSQRDNASSSNTQTPSASNNFNNNILETLLKNPQALNLIKKFLPIFLNSQQDNNQQPSDKVSKLITDITSHNQAKSNSSQESNFSSQQNQSNNTTTFPEINPQYSIENLMNTSNQTTEQKDKTLDYSKEYLIKQMNLHQSMLNRLKQNNF